MQERIVLYTQPGGKLTQAEHYELAGLLVKAGYTVRVGKVKVGEKQVTAIVAGKGGEE